MPLSIYGVATAFLAVGFALLSRHRRAAAPAFANGLMVLGMSMLTDYPGGVRPTISFRGHRTGDTAQAALAGSVPCCSASRGTRRRIISTARRSVKPESSRPPTGMRRKGHRHGGCVQLAGAAFLAISASGCGQVGLSQPQSTTESQCRVDGALAPLPGLPEASGVAVSHHASGRFWTHNDSGQPELLMIDARGAITARVQLPGATVVDWEAIAAGPCPAGSCLYVADIGDNNARRRQITIYRVTEPADAHVSTATVEAFHGTYPDGPHDAETLLVAPDGSVYIVTKGSTGPVALYRFPRGVRAGAPAVQLERIGEPRSAKRVNNDERFTDGAVSSDGARVVLRTHDWLFFFRTPQFFAGNWQEDARVNIEHVGEPQGEGVAFGPGNTVYLVGEGGDGSNTGTFAQLQCAG